MTNTNTFHQLENSAMASALHLQDVCVSVENTKLAGPINLTVAPGEIFTIMGPSGCGKSSLLAAISGTLPTNVSVSGDIRLGTQSITALPPEERHIGMLFQDDLLFPHLSVGENLKFGIPASVKKRDERDALAEKALDDAGLSGYMSRDPATLSGGQRARVAVLRTLLSRPCVLLLDEPFSKLDVKLRDKFRQFVFRHVKAHHLPTLLVTHDPDDAAATSGEIIQMANTLI